VLHKVRRAAKAIALARVLDMPAQHDVQYVNASGPLAARGESRAWHRGRRCARLARRDDQGYREYL